MKFISYAQNFEDVMLWRALKHIHNGFYVDVGASDPLVHSVSQAFYLKGWHGVHIEPVPEKAELLRQQRPDEAVLEIALSDNEGILPFHIVPSSIGISSALKCYIQKYDYYDIQVKTLTLNSALAPWIHQEIHWLKIDVEGYEEKVLKGWNSKIIRPWVIVIEAVIPESPAFNFAAWDPILIAADYIFAYFDGINRFYVAKEQSDLLAAFYAPPNFFDNFQLNEVLEAQNRVQMVTGKLEATEARLAENETRLLETAARLREIESVGIIKNIFYALPSWLQKPLRLIKKFLITKKVRYSL